MQEEFLHYIWRFQQFHKNNLKTTDGQSISILKSGVLNSHSGPDFENCRLIINEIEWAGSVEVHVKSSEWDQHNHQFDESYDKVILHVVWENDKDVFRKDKTILPVLELKNLVFVNALKNYQNLQNSGQEFPCEPFFKDITTIARLDMLEKALASRLEMKAAILKDWLVGLNNDFEELAYRVFAQNMGFKLNSETFLRLSENIPFKILKKHQQNIFQLEALLFGMAGFLANPQDDYAQKLNIEFEFLAKKYSIFENRLKRSEWRFLRTRPGNFPTIRLAQFAAILNKNQNLYSFFVETETKKELENGLKAEVSDYWKEHYDFGKISKKSPKIIGESSVNNIIINTISQILALTADQKSNFGYFDRAIGFLTDTPAENNLIIRKFESLGLEINNAFDTQGIIQQYKYKCNPRKCLNCSIGIEILKREN
ncbi:MAG: DUF2851 family protein [Cytophagaceae bacterium]|nr:DUF2851 family protein [Cytophagaceae bacterium]